MTESDWHEFLLSFENTTTDSQTDEHLVLFRAGESRSIFAAVEKESKPVRISLRCDSLLSRNLREKYETVLPARKFDPKTWNTVIVTGQLTDDEVKDLARLSYNLTTNL